MVALLCGGFLFSQRPQPCDDAYITFRHARNLVEHGRPAWNLDGRPVLGSTSPAYLLTLSLPALIFGADHLPWIALACNSIFNACISYLAFLILIDLRCRPTVALAGGLVIGISSVNVMIFAQGFENGMYTAVLLLGLWQLRTGRLAPAAVSASLAPLIRPEGILLTGIGFFVGVVRGQARMKFMLSLAAVPIVWTVCATAYYGTPIPHSLIAMKRFPAIHVPFEDKTIGLIDRLPDAPIRAFDIWVDQAGPLLAHGVFRSQLILSGIDIRYWAVLAGALSGIANAFRSRDLRFVYALYPPLFLLLFGLLYYVKAWYWPSFIATSLLLVVAGWGSLIERFTTIPRLGGPLVSGVARFVAILALTSFLLLGNRYSLRKNQYEHQHKGILFSRHPMGELWELWEAQRFDQYTKAAALINAQHENNPSALITEVGIFGFHLNGKVIDSIGLCSPEALQFYPPPPEDIFRPDGAIYPKAETLVPLKMVQALQPDYIVNSMAYIANLFRPGADVPERYLRFAELGKVWGEPVLILKRADLCR